MQDRTSQPDPPHDAGHASTHASTQASSNDSTSPALTRRRFVALVAAGSAAALTSPLVAAAVSAATAAAHPAPAHAGAGAAAMSAMSVADRKEFERQRKSTLDTVAVIRKHAMEPGTEMASVFQALKRSRRNG